ncbi:MAG: DNA-binding transcriptional repressor ArsR [Methanocella sp. PtaU1.Bin125]|nr:MAG: DNA-binding transcriptional repressor ArsR [Methanocella sp. PtaU1.Bin125]
MKILPGCCGKTESNGRATLPPEETIRAQADYMKAVSDPARIRIIYALKDGELCVCEIMARLEMPQTMVSHHCKILKIAGIVSDRKLGKWVYYFLADRRALDMLKTLYNEG